ncbi:hypothetical protein CIPAW_04G148300 [Carya illinoinensis]|uniref:Uncharacterized protein n=1 Tax=Carya illinoinensis TaxID=32201 RepID=A0A8T1QVI2_CARIL|nr:hypothetical protein CIPAW_04G148300 [Carya illinoinensis]
MRLGLSFDAVVKFKAEQKRKKVPNTCIFTSMGQLWCDDTHKKITLV